jgi:LPXTG-motif cell wall-anchored protein
MGVTDVRIGRTLAAVGIGAVMAVIGSPAVGAAANRPDLRVVGTFDKASYVAGESATVTFTIRNAGTATATNIQVTGGDAQGFELTTLATLGFDLAPGETRPAVYVGTVTEDGACNGFTAFASGFGSDEEDANPEDNNAVASARVPGAAGDLVGYVFHEADGDEGTADEGQGVAGVRIALTDEFSGVAGRVAVTDANGEFSLTGIPVGAYIFKLTLPPGWKLGGFHVTNGAQVTCRENERVLISLVPAPITATTSPPTPNLPVTGFPTSLVAGAGVALAVVGVALVVFGRRRRTTT